MIKNMDLKITARKEQGNVFRFLDFAGQKFLIGMYSEKSLNKKTDSFLQDCQIPVGISAAFITGTPENWLDFCQALINHNFHNEDNIVNVHISRNAYSLIRNSIENKAAEALSAGRHNEAKDIKKILDCFVPHDFNEKFEIGNASLEFIGHDNNPISAALRVRSGENSLLIAQAAANTESFTDKNDVLFLDIPLKYMPSGRTDVRQENKPVSLEQLASAINEAKKKLGLFFIPSELYNIPLIIRELNSMQDKGLISPEIRICPIGAETKEVVRLYEECGMKLNYASAYLRKINAVSLPREANCGFRLFITPGEDLSDTRHSFSASLYSFIKCNPIATVAYPGSCLPSDLLADNANEGNHCKLILCDMLGTPDGKSALDAMRHGGFSAAVITGNSMKLCEDASASINSAELRAFVLPHQNEIINFYRNEDNKAIGYKNSETCVLAASVGSELESLGISSAYNILKQIRSCDENLKFGKIILLCNEKDIDIAEKIRQDSVEKCGVPADIISVPEKCSDSGRFLVNAIVGIADNYKDIALFAGGSKISNAWMYVFSVMSGKKLFYPHKNGISCPPEIPVRFDNSQILTYWPLIHRIVDENCKELLKSVPEELANTSLSYDAEKDKYSFTAYGLIMDYYERSEKSLGASASKLWNKPNTARELPKAVVFTIGKTLLDNYIRQKCGENCDAQVSKDNLVSFIREDAENAFRSCCQELETLFSLPDPKMLKSCRKVFLIALDNHEEKIVSEAFEEFFGTIGIEAETVFIEPFEKMDEYQPDSLGLRTMSAALLGIKRRFGNLLFLLCGNYCSINFNAYVASILFKDQPYMMSEGRLELIPVLPLDIDISEYSGLMEFMGIMSDLNLQDRYEKLPEIFKGTIVRKTERGLYFTSFKPLFDGAVYVQNPGRFNVRNHGNGVLMRGAEKGKMSQPFFIVKKHNE